MAANVNSVSGQSGMEQGRATVDGAASPNQPAYSTPPIRWFPEPSVAGIVSSLHTEIARIDVDRESRIASKEAAKAGEIKSMGRMSVVIAVVLIGILIGINVLGDPGERITGGSLVLLLAMIIIPLLIALFGFGRVYGVRATRIKRRLGALRDLAKRTDSLNCGHFSKLGGDSVGAIPWVASEMDRVVECDLRGAHRGYRLALLRCSYVIDSTLTAIEDALGGGAMGKVASKIMSHVDHENFTRHELEAVVFLNAVNALPDIFFAAKRQPLIWYFQRAFQDHGLDPISDDSHWLASSDARRCRDVFKEETLQLLASRPDAMLQLIGGHVVVISGTWKANRPEMADDVEKVRQTLDWACDIYESLGGVEASAAAPSMVTPVAESAAVSEMAAETPDMAAMQQAHRQLAKPRQRHWLIKTLAGLVGFPTLFLFGGATILMVHQCLTGAEAADVESAANAIAIFVSGGIALFGLWLAAISLGWGSKRQGPP